MCSWIRSDSFWMSYNSGRVVYEKILQPQKSAPNFHSFRMSYKNNTSREGCLWKKKIQPQKCAPNFHSLSPKNVDEKKKKKYNLKKMHRIFTPSGWVIKISLPGRVVYEEIKKKLQPQKSAPNFHSFRMSYKKYHFLILTKP